MTESFHLVGSTEYKQQQRENWKRETTRLLDLVDYLRYRRQDGATRFTHLTSLSATHRCIAGYEYYLEHHLDAFKQHTHVSALAGLRRWSEPTHEHLSILGSVLDAVISDSPSLMRDIASFEHSELVSPRPSSVDMETVLFQFAILGRDDALADSLERIATKGKTADQQELQRGHNFFDCLIKRDAQALIGCILRTTSTPFAKNDPYFGFFMHKMATAQAKLCHLRGIMVEIDHPLVPMDIVRVAPLAHYDNVYDFLEPGFTPLKPTLKDRWRFYMRQRARNKP